MIEREENVQKAIEKYNSIFEWDCNRERFQVKLILLLKQKGAKKVRIAICDDQEIVLKMLKKLIEECMKEGQQEYEI